MMKSMPADLENLVNEYKRGFERCLHCTQIAISRIQPLISEIDEHFQMYHDLLLYVDPLEEDTGKTLKTKFGVIIRSNATLIVPI